MTETRSGVWPGNEGCRLQAVSLAPSYAMKPTTSLPALLLFLFACGTDDAPASADLHTPEAADAGEAPFQRACARLHGECASVCLSPFLECYGDPGTCADQWEADFLADFEDPLIDTERMRRCAEQVDEQSCTDLEPDTLECEYAIVDSCAGDRDELGQPYSPFLATAVATDAELHIEVCPRVEEFVAIELDRGAVLEIVRPEDAPSSFFRLLQLLPDSRGDAVLHEYPMDQPVPEDGVYLVSILASDRTDQRLRLVPTFPGDEE